MRLYNKETIHTSKGASYKYKSRGNPNKERDLKQAMSVDYAEKQATGN
jgi:hypothetical protein